MPKIAPKPRREWSEQSVELSRLLAQTGLGDRSAFGQLYERSSAHLYAVVLRITRDRGTAEDVLQDVYVNVWRAAGSFDAVQSQPLTWLTSIARNRAIDSVRRQQARPSVQPVSSHDDLDSNVYDTIADTSPGPLELLTRASDARGLSDCMQGLTPVQRQSVALAFFDGLSHAEVAVSMGHPLGTVKSWVRRALVALRSCLDAASSRDGPSTRAAAGSRAAV